MLTVCHHIGDVMVNMLALSVVDRGFDPQTVILVLLFLQRAYSFIVGSEL
jgi:hypothetical protein